MPKMSTYYRRKAEHRCVVCDAELPEGYTKTRCPTCREFVAGKSAVRHAMFRIDGRCPSCGRKLPQDSEYLTCYWCRETAKQSQRRHRARLAEKGGLT